MLRSSICTLTILRLARAKYDSMDILMLFEACFVSPAGPTLPAEGTCFTALHTLALHECNIDDAVLELVTRRCPHLRSLDLTANPEVTGVGVVDVVRALEGKLETLNLTLCRGVSADTVAWARAKGVRVTYVFPDAKSGKKLPLAY